MVDNGSNGGFWREKLFYILIVLILGSYAYTAFFGNKLVDATVCNDRLRQVGDDRMATELQAKVDTVNKDVAIKLDKIQIDITDIKIAIAKLAK